MASHRPLSPPDPQTSSKIALKGAIGLALEMALEDVQNELRCTGQHDKDQDNNDQHHPTGDNDDTDNADDSHPVVPNITAPSTISPTTLLPSCVQECFGTSVATTDWNVAPRAILRGRLDHYNRFQGQWRIVIDTQAELGPRPKDNHVGNNKRKRDESIMFSLEKGDNAIKLDDKVQILVYNDV
jgi:hypothetical protein